MQIVGGQGLLIPNHDPQFPPFKTHNWHFSWSTPSFLLHLKVVIASFCCSERAVGSGSSHCAGTKRGIWIAQPAIFVPANSSGWWQLIDRQKRIAEGWWVVVVDVEVHWHQYWCHWCGWSREAESGCSCVMISSPITFLPWRAFSWDGKELVIHQSRKIHSRRMFVCQMQVGKILFHSLWIVPKTFANDGLEFCWISAGPRVLRCGGQHHTIWHSHCYCWFQHKAQHCSHDISSGSKKSARPSCWSIL